MNGPLDARPVCSASARAEGLRAGDAPRRGEADRVERAGRGRRRRHKLRDARSACCPSPVMCRYGSCVTGLYPADGACAGVTTHTLRVASTRACSTAARSAFSRPTSWSNVAIWCSRAATTSSGPGWGSAVINSGCTTRARSGKARSRDKGGSTLLWRWTRRSRRGLWRWRSMPACKSRGCV